MWMVCMFLNKLTWSQGGSVATLLAIPLPPPHIGSGINLLICGVKSDPPALQMYFWEGQNEHGVVGRPRIPSVTRSDTASGLRTHQRLITPQVIGPWWHPLSETGFYEDWKLTRQVFPFKSAGIYISQWGRRPQRWLHTLLVVTEGSNVDSQS